MLDKIAEINGSVNGVVWGIFGLALLIGTGVITTICTKVFQVSHIGHWWKETIGSMFKKDVISHSKEKGSISPFQALCTALAATIGVGNIAGVAAAIVIGGPGAVFWMWVAAFFGMMTNFSENVLGIYYRRKNELGEWAGGPMYYLRDGLGSKKNCRNLGKVLAVLFSIFAILASFGIGNMGQVNKITINIESAFFSNAPEYKIGNIPLIPLLIGVALMIVGALIIIGGLQRIAATAEKIVPFMAVTYVVGCIIVLAVNIDQIGAMFAAIFKFAFGVKAVGGAAVGIVFKEVVTQGFKRGVFSNEAGLGSAPIAAATVKTDEPVAQGLVSMTGTVIDTLIICTMTGLSILVTGTWNIGLEGVNVTIAAFQAGLPFPATVSSFILMMCLVFFAFTTILGWDYYSERCMEYIVGDKPKVIKAFRWTYILAICIGPYMTVSAVWTIADIFNGLMAFPNLIALVALSGVVVAETKKYFDKQK